MRKIMEAYKVKTGGVMISRETKKDRQRHPWRPAGRVIPGGSEARWGRTRVREVEYEAARTIALGEFEFARVGIVVSAAGIDAVALLDAERELAAEFLGREEAAVTGVPREPQPYPALAGVRRSLGISYGMTLRGEGKRETVKFDVHLHEPLADGAGIEAAMGRIVAWLEDRVREERAAVQGEKPDEGL
jgi:hypothetical protein